MHWAALLAGLWEAGSWEKKILRTWGKVTQEIFTPPHQFSQIPIKPNPTTRNNVSPGSDPQMLRGWTLRFPHQKIIRALPGNCWLLEPDLPTYEGPKDGPNDITKRLFLFLASVKSLRPKIIPPDGLCGCDGISQISKLIFDLQQKIEHIRSWRPWGPWGNIKLIHQISSNIIVLHDWLSNSSAINLSKSHPLRC